MERDVNKPLDAESPPGRPRAAARIEPLGDEEEVYALRQVAPPKPPEPRGTGLVGATPSAAPEEAERETPEDRAARREEQEELAWEAVGRARPGPMLCAGTFGFPFRLNSLVPLLTLSCVGMAALGTIAVASYYVATDERLLGAFVGVVGTLIGVGWLAMWAIYGVTIVTETAAGCPAVEDWPNVFAMEGASGILYAGVALALAGVPGSVAAPLAGAMKLHKSVVFILSVAVLFPPLFLSSLERHSPFDLFSPAIWRSVTHAWRAWRLFYLLVSALAIAIAGLAWLAHLCGAVFGVVVLSCLLAAAGMFYFRLLGRLAWFCSGRWAWEDDARRTGEVEESD